MQSHLNVKTGIAPLLGDAKDKISVKSDGAFTKEQKGEIFSGIKSNTFIQDLVISVVSEKFNTQYAKLKMLGIGKSV